MNNFLILGCGGFVGSHLVDRLLAGTEARIVGWDLSTEKIAHQLANPRLVVRVEDIGAGPARERLERDIAAADWVINLAAVCNPAQYNTEPLLTIYRNFIDAYPVAELCAAHGKRLMYFSTSEVYGRTIASHIPSNCYDDPGLYMLDAERAPLVLGPISAQRWSYASAKQLYERLVYAFHRERGLRYAIVRPFNFFGPRMDYLPGIEGTGKPRVMACFLAALLLGHPLEVVDGGTARRIVTSIHDAVDALMAIIERPQALNGIYNIANPGNEISILELAERMREVFADVAGDDRHRQHPIRMVSSRDFYGEGYEDCDRRMVDIAPEQARLGWTPQRPLQAILEETTAYYYARYRTGRPINPAAASVA